MFAFTLAALVVCAIASVFDLRTGRIPNALTYGAIVLAFVGHAAHGFALGGLPSAARAVGFTLLGALACGVIPAIVFFLRGMGGGDVKLFVAIGALCHAYRGFQAESLSFVAAVVLAPAYLAYEGKLLKTLARSLSLILNPFRPKDKRAVVAPELLAWIRLAPAVFLGTGLMIFLGS